MPVEFLSDDQVSAYGRFTSGFSRAELERYFFLDDVDRALIGSKRRDHNKLGFAVQLVTVRYVGRFLDDPLDGVPVELVEYLAEQLGIADPTCVKSYGERDKARLEHLWEIGDCDRWRSSVRSRPTWATGSRAGPGRPVTGRKRCSTRAWVGCGNAGSCCRG